MVTRAHRLTLFVALAASLWAATTRPATLPRAAVFAERLPGLDPALTSWAEAQARAAGYETELLGTAGLTNRAVLSPARYGLLVLPGARVLPGVTAPAIEGYLRQGGNLLALGLPAWDAATFALNGQWISRPAYEAALAAQRPQHLIEDFSQADLARWTRSTNERQPWARYELTDAEGGRALHAAMPRMTGWETFLSPALSRPFPAGHTLTCFRARGGARTRQLALEWMEEDGSRWIATVDVRGEWQDYALPPEAFKAWQPPPDRGGKGDRFNPAKAARWSIGLALTHTAVEGQRQEYWFARLGSAPNPFGDQGPPTGPDIPRLESLAPGYQFFSVSRPVLIRIDHQKARLEDWEDQAPASEAPPGLLGLHPRPRGVGYRQDRPWRWEPLLGAYDAQNGDYRGAVGALIAHTEGGFRGGAWAMFTPADPSFYRHPTIARCVAQTLARLRRGVFFSEGGAEFFTVFPGQHFKLGARVVNLGREAAANLSVKLFLGDQMGRRLVKESAVRVAAGESAAAEAELAEGIESPRLAEVFLLAEGKVIDALRHEVGVWQAPARPEYIEARGGGFWLGDKPWKAHGINYMPSSGIGVADPRFFEYWLGRGAYDPEVIERDLRRIRAMNLNAVSVFVYHDSMQAQHLLDFLRRCQTLGLRVNQSLRPGTPMDFRWAEMKELIEFYRLAQDDTVFAYDLAWEPSHGSQSDQEQAYAAAWTQWVKQRYGGLEPAERAWGVGARRKDGSLLSVPPMGQLIADGPWRKLAADYRAFLDAILAEKYGAARQLVRSIDPHHAVSFRMSSAGDPTYNWEAALTYDFHGLAAAVDIWEPEAYGRIGDWEEVKAGAFTVAYARLCDRRKPCLWAEMGYNVWDLNHMAADPAKLALAARYFADFYRMMTDSGADGVFFWWYPGGFRLGENSDFGIINPDGTDRPVTQVIRAEGARFLEAPKPPPPDYWLAVDRDRDARGLFGIYQAARDEFWRAKAEGHRPGLKWGAQPGTKRAAP
jgi:hypothetical protein